MSYSLLSSSSCLSSSSSPSLASLDHTKQDRSRSSHPLLHTHHVASSHTTKHPSHCSHEEHREYTPSQLDLHRLELKLDMFSHDKQQQINELHKEMATIKTQLVTEMHKMRLDMQQELKLMEQRFRHQLQLVTTQFQQQQQSTTATPSMSVSDSLDHYDDERSGPSWFWPSYDFVDADCSNDGMGMGMNMGMNMGMHMNSHTHMGMQHQSNINNTPQRGNRPATTLPQSHSTPSVASIIAAITKPTPHPTIPTPTPSTSDAPIEDLSDPAIAAASSAPLITPHTRKGSITETSLVALATRILSKHGSVPVGKMGSLLHKAANNHALPALLKERYGGLKKFLQSHDQYFTLGEDHPYNPHVALKVKDASATTATTTETSTDASAKTETTPSSPPTESTSTDSPASPTPLDSTNAVSPISSSSSSGSSANTPPLLPLTTRTTRTTTSECHALGMNAGMAGSTSSTTVTTTMTTPNRIGRTGSTTPPNFSNCLAIDCEMVGIGPGGTRSCLARCSIVNYHGQVIYDQYVRPTEVVTDYRTHVSGIRASDLENATEFHVVQKEVADLIKDRIIIAHSVVADLQALLLSHPPHLIRDTAFFPLLCPSRPRSLKCLVKERLGVDFQCGEHDSVEDARAVLAVYKSCAQEWEALITSGGCTHTSNMTTSTTTSTMVKENAYSPPHSSHAMDVMLDTYHHHQKSSQFFY